MAEPGLTIAMWLLRTAAGAAGPRAKLFLLGSRAERVIWICLGEAISTAVIAAMPSETVPVTNRFVMASCREVLSAQTMAYPAAPALDPGKQLRRSVHNFVEELRASPFPNTIPFTETVGFDPAKFEEAFLSGLAYSVQIHALTEPSLSGLSVILTSFDLEGRLRDELDAVRTRLALLEQDPVGEIGLTADRLPHSADRELVSTQKSCGSLFRCPEHGSVAVAINDDGLLVARGLRTTSVVVDSSGEHYPARTVERGSWLSMVQIEAETTPVPFERPDLPGIFKMTVGVLASDCVTVVEGSVVGVNMWMKVKLSASRTTTIRNGLAIRVSKSTAPRFVAGPLFSGVDDHDPLRGRVVGFVVAGANGSEGSMLYVVDPFDDLPSLEPVAEMFRGWEA